MMFTFMVESLVESSTTIRHSRASNFTFEMTVVIKCLARAIQTATALSDFSDISRVSRLMTLQLFRTNCKRDCFTQKRENLVDTCCPNVLNETSDCFFFTQFLPIIQCR